MGKKLLVAAAILGAVLGFTASKSDGQAEAYMTGCTSSAVYSPYGLYNGRSFSCTDSSGNPHEWIRMRIRCYNSTFNIYYYAYSTWIDDAYLTVGARCTSYYHAVVSWNYQYTQSNPY